MILSSEEVRGNLAEGDGDSGGLSKGREIAAAEDLEVDLGMEGRDVSRGESRHGRTEG